ncbi:hypothetical protein V8C42DRAFT_23299 [Trichoderma barbatum]
MEYSRQTACWSLFAASNMLLSDPCPAVQMGTWVAPHDVSRLSKAQPKGVRQTRETHTMDAKRNKETRQKLMMIKVKIPVLLSNISRKGTKKERKKTKKKQKWPPPDLGARVNEASWAAHWLKMRRHQPIRNGTLVFASIMQDGCFFVCTVRVLLLTVGGLLFFFFSPLLLFSFLFLAWGETRLGMMGTEAHVSCLFTCLWCVPEMYSKGTVRCLLR